MAVRLDRILPLTARKEDLTQRRRDAKEERIEHLHHPNVIAMPRFLFELLELSSPTRGEGTPLNPGLNFRFGCWIDADDKQGALEWGYVLLGNYCRARFAGTDISQQYSGTPIERGWIVDGELDDLDEIARYWEYPSCRVGEIPAWHEPWRFQIGRYVYVPDPERFPKSPWGDIPAEEWNCPVRLCEYYLDLLREENTWRREQAVYYKINSLLRLLCDAGELPLQAPRKLLDAGCGIPLTPHILAYWGFQVSAVDLCDLAIEFAKRQQPEEWELARCLEIRDPVPDLVDTWQVVNDPARSLAQLREFQRPGGSVTYRAEDWLTADLSAASYDVICCRNSLRFSPKPYWRRSLDRFQELLAPGGVLLLENINAIWIREDVEVLLAEHGFKPLPAGERDASSKYYAAIWPTG